jgi:ribosomal protein S18 acetylase RimI-like enzyme
MELTIKKLSPDLLKDYLYFFDNIVFTENPHWSMCYCFSYHFTGSREQWNKEANRASVIQYINENKMRGYLAFSGDIPVGWCNANDRLNYQRLADSWAHLYEPEDKICSIVCFLISPEYRRKGIARKILTKLCADYRALNYDFIEAYPRKGKLTSEGQFKGPFELYEESGFTVLKEYKDYYIMRKSLK